MALSAVSKPVVARVQGPAFGGGVGLVAAADVVLASSAASFVLSEVRLGIAPALIARYLIERIGIARFRSWVMLGRAVDPARAEVAGLVDQVVPDGDLDRALALILTDLRKGEPGALAAVKRFERDGMDRERATAVLDSLRDRPAFGEGIAALREGRLANWVAPSSPASE